MNSINRSTKDYLKMRTRDRIRGSLMAGAAGDALGYAVEFCAGETFRSVMASMAFGHLIWTLKAE